MDLMNKYKLAEQRTKKGLDIYFRVYGSPKQYPGDEQSMADSENQNQCGMPGYVAQGQGETGEGGEAAWVRQRILYVVLRTLLGQALWKHPAEGSLVSFLSK